MIRAALRTSRPRHAYTLVEVLIVVVLLGIATALVVPNLGSTDVLRIQSTVRAIVADINFAQSDALARQQGRAIIFDQQTNNYVILEVNGATLNPVDDTISRVDLNNARKFRDSHIESVNFDGSNVLVFDEMGGPVSAPSSTTPSAGGNLVISGAGSRFRISVEAYTGRVTVNRL